VYTFLFVQYVQKNHGGELLEKVISSYKHMLNAPTDEDTVMRKCQAALSIFDNLNKSYENNSYLGKMIQGIFQ
jgi:regulator of Ty1 transposition protein 103